MGHPSEPRHRRERFTRSLRKMCEELDARSEFRGHVQDRERSAVLRDPSGHIAVKVCELWAFGSWARGAHFCADLDLALRLDARWLEPPVLYGQRLGIEASRPGFNTLRRLVLSARPLVRILDETEVAEPGSDARGMFRFSRADFKLIWRHPSLGSPYDWNAAIEAVVPDASAGSLPRATDQFPLRLEQTAMTRDAVEKAIAAQQAGLLSWRFVEHSRTRDEPAPSEDTGLPRPKLVDAPRDEGLVRRVLAATRDVQLRYGPRLAYWFGRCGVWPTMLDSRNLDAIVITPRWTPKGPNGSLIIERGAAYSVEAVYRFVEANQTCGTD